MQRIGIVVKPRKDEAAPVLCPLVEWLRARGKEVLLDREVADLCPDAGPGLPRPEIAAQADLIVVLGGTARSSRWLACWRDGRCPFSGSTWGGWAS